MKYIVDIKKHNFFYLKFIRDFINTLPKFLQKVELEEDNNFYNVTLYVSSEFIKDILSFLKYHTQYQYEQLIDLTAVDKLKSDDRFYLFYQLLSLRFNRRLTVCVNNLGLLASLESINFLYESAGWLEREVWDMFGIFFFGHSDLRRILTDYGFKGFPLRKDFPLSGFSEVRYDDEIKLVFYEPLELSQEFRFFDALNPWNIN